jgi:hypothetical protein
MNAIDYALYYKLNGGTALTSLLAGTTAIYHSVAPRGALLPYIIYNQQGGGDANDSPRRDKNLVYTVRAVADSSYRYAGLIDDAVDDLLHGATLTVTGWTNYWTMREQDIEYTETTSDGQHIWHVGGMYRIRICE